MLSGVVIPVALGAAAGGLIGETLYNRPVTGAVRGATIAAIVLLAGAFFGPAGVYATVALLAVVAYKSFHDKGYINQKIAVLGNSLKDLQGKLASVQGKLASVDEQLPHTGLRLKLGEKLGEENMSNAEKFFGFLT